ncbi:helix-turn-helix domain-containing protein [Rhodobacter sp. 24-YEA-8]|uniref:helix-turn-helix domain-containing protein n=1 Tax=Rhodobacter sp. 24-YEA-8 TaxID=1884310 RepID=UPI000895482D|nr:helix-turn-helix domain-containing protein [Rhodobacter sp. 24-YEA-8]SED91177.1 Ribbon-helix-helix protein, copG family [Rhodobacter sp. 24-YEA-8]
MYSLHSTKTTNRRLSLSESKEIAEAAARGESVTALAVRFGVSRPTIYRAITRHSAPAAGQGRRPANSRPVAVRLNPDELAAFDVLSGRMNLSRSELARQVLRRAADFLEPDEEVSQAVQDLTRQLKSIGGNLNQIAAHLNRDARFHGSAKPNSAQMKQVEGIEREVKSLAKRLDSLFQNTAGRRRAKVADLLKGVQP